MPFWPTVAELNGPAECVYTNNSLAVAVVAAATALSAIWTDMIHMQFTLVSLQPPLLQ